MAVAVAVTDRHSYLACSHSCPSLIAISCVEVVAIFTGAFAMPVITRVIAAASTQCSMTTLVKTRGEGDACHDADDDQEQHHRFDPAGYGTTSPDPVYTHFSTRPFLMRAWASVSNLPNMVWVSYFTLTV